MGKKDNFNKKETNEMMRKLLEAAKNNRLPDDLYQN